MDKIKEKVIVASSLRKEYKINDLVIEALKSINLQVNKNEFISLYGPSGAGKTTFLNLIGGLDKPSSGELSVFGHDLAHFNEDFLATFRCIYIGYVLNCSKIG